MAKGICILLGAGPVSGAGIARAFAKNNYAVAMLSRTQDRLDDLSKSIRETTGGIAHGFASDTSRPSLQKALDSIRSHQDFQGLPLKAAIWHVKHSSKSAFLDVKEETLDEMYETYIKGAFSFAQLTIPLLLEGNKQSPDLPPGTLIYTGTLGALRCSANFASYGISRAAVRQLAQSLGREYREQGLHVVHTIANGGIGEDVEAAEAGKKMHADTVGDTYVWLAEQKRDLFTSELDLRPAGESW